MGLPSPDSILSEAVIFESFLSWVSDPLFVGSWFDPVYDEPSRSTSKGVSFPFSSSDSRGALNSSSDKPVRAAAMAARTDKIARASSMLNCTSEC